MGEINKQIIKKTIIWTAVYIGFSTLLTIAACPGFHWGFFIYHLMFIPVYLIGFGLTTSLFQFLKKKYIKNSIVLLVLLIIMIALASSQLRDCRTAFNPLVVRDIPLPFLTELLNAGCREMFFFLSLVLSSITMAKSLISIPQDQGQKE